MADVGQLSVSVKAEEASLKNASNRIKKEFSDTGDQIEKKLNKSLIWWMQAFASAWIAAWLNKVAWWALTLAGNLQQADAAFTTMLWSADASKKMLKDLSDFARVTPFELTGIRETAKQMLAMWVSADDMIPTLKSLWDVSAALAVPIERLALNYGQVRVQWKLTGREIRDFSMAWVPLIAELAKNLWVSEKAIGDMASAGKISFADVEKAFQTMTSAGGKFADYMKNQWATLPQAWSNFKDAMNSLGEVLWWLFTDSVTKATKWLSWLVDWFKNWVQENPALAKSITTIIFVFWSLLSIIWLVAWAIALLTPLFIWTAWIITAVAWGVALLTWWLVLLNSQTWDATNSSEKLTNQFKKLYKEQANLDEQFRKWTITQEEYEKWTQKISSAIDKLSASNKTWTLSQKDLNEAMLKLNNITIKTDADVQELKNLAEQAKLTAMSLLDAAKAKLKAFATESKLAKDQIESEQTMQWKRSLSWWWSVSQISAINLLRPDEFLKQSEELWKINSEIKKYDDMIKDIDKSFEQLNSRKVSAWGGGWWWSWSGWLSDQAKQLIKDQATVYKESFGKIEDELKKSGDRVDDYKKKIKEVGDEFTALANKAWDELFSVNQSLDKLSTDYTNTQGARYAEVMARYNELWTKVWTGLTMDESNELSRLEKEKAFLLTVTTEQVRYQAVEYSKLWEAQKNAIKYEEEKTRLLEKQALLTAISTQTTWVDASGNSVLDQKLRVTDANQYEYESEKGKWIAITDAKNIEYARDIMNQQMKMQSELMITQQKIDQEYILQEDLNTKKMTLEADFTKFVMEQTTAQKKVVNELIVDINKAIAAINALNALNAKSKSSSSKWFMAWWYTGEWSLNQEAGVVHAREYVLSNAMLTKLPWIVPALEAIRTGNTIDNSRNVSMGSVIVQNQMDFELLLDKIRFMHL